MRHRHLPTRPVLELKARALWQPVIELPNSDHVVFVTQHFGLRCQEHRDMYVEDFSFSPVKTVRYQ